MPITTSLPRAITRAITHPLSQAITSPPIGGGWTPAQLFMASEPGAWLDPSDMSTMFQDSAGTTPVTAVEQPVGLILDKRLGATLGPELIANGTFDSGVSGWAAGFSTTTTSFSASGGVATMTQSGGDANPRYVYALTGLTVGKTYKLSTRVTAKAGSGEVRLGFTNSSNGTGGVESTGATGVTNIGLLAVATATTMYVSLIFVAPSAGATFSVDDVSGKLVTGNHASQATTAAKPKLRLDGANYYNYFDRVDDHVTAEAGGGGTTGICVCAAIRAGGAGNARTIWSDRGTNTGYRLSINASNQLVLSAGNGSAHTEAVGPTVTAGTDYVVTGWHDGTNLNVQINAGAATSAAFGTATAGTAGFTIGRDNGTASGLYGERIYEIVYRKNDTSSAGDRTTLINYMAAQAGITL